MTEQFKIKFNICVYSIINKSNIDFKDIYDYSMESVHINYDPWKGENRFFVVEIKGILIKDTNKGNLIINCDEKSKDNHEIILFSTLKHFKPKNFDVLKMTLNKDLSFTARGIFLL